MKYNSAVQCSIYSFIHLMGTLFHFVYCNLFCRIVLNCIISQCIILNCITVHCSAVCSTVYSVLQCTPPAILSSTQWVHYCSLCIAFVLCRNVLNCITVQCTSYCRVHHQLFFPPLNGHIIVLCVLHL